MKTAIERFSAKYMPVPESGCWLWLGWLDRRGYGWFQVNGRRVGEHRFSYETLAGEAPGMDIDHLCRVPSCVNPSHLEAVTHRENILRGVCFAAANAKKETCPRNHVYDAANTRISSMNQRHCRTCHRDRERRRRQAAKKMV